MKIASIQPEIKEGFLDTVEGQFHLMEEAAKQEAELILLPELATTGFTGRIAKEERAIVSEHVSRTIERFHQWSRKAGIALSFGSVVFPKNEDRQAHNAMLTILPDGSEFRDDKIILMKGREEQFFISGETRSGFSYMGVKFDFLICCEFMQPEQASRLISPDTDVVLWPGCIRHNTGVDSLEAMNEESIRTFAFDHQLQIVSSNWANFLDGNPNRPGNMGGSYVATPEGKISHRCKWDEEDFLIINYQQDPTKRCSQSRQLHRLEG